jgi:rod shape-determining protein MreC
MRNLIEFLVRHYFAVLFLVFESFNFVLIVEFNEFQKQIFFNFSNSVSANINYISSSIINYFNLEEKNTELLQENARLKKKVELLKSLKKRPERTQLYEFIPSKVVSSTVSYQNNFLILNKGRDAGVKKNMAVVSPSGAVGVVYNVSKHFCSVLSLLNVKAGVSSKIKRLNYPCIVTWDGKDYRYGKINDLPSHLHIKKGDSIVTSGFSAIFPENIYVGKIVKFEKQENKNFYNVTVKYGVDFKTVSNVHIVMNKYKAEFDSLKNTSVIDE